MRALIFDELVSVGIGKGGGVGERLQQLKKFLDLVYQQSVLICVRFLIREIRILSWISMLIERSYKFCDGVVSEWNELWSPNLDKTLICVQISHHIHSLWYLCGFRILHMSICIIF